MSPVGRHGKLTKFPPHHWTYEFPHLGYIVTHRLLHFMFSVWCHSWSSFLRTSTGFLPPRFALGLRLGPVLLCFTRRFPNRRALLLPQAASASQSPGRLARANSSHVAKYGPKKMKMGVSLFQVCKLLVSFRVPLSGTDPCVSQVEARCRIAY